MSGFEISPMMIPVKSKSKKEIEVRKRRKMIRPMILLMKSRYLESSILLSEG